MVGLVGTGIEISHPAFREVTFIQKDRVKAMRVFLSYQSSDINHACAQAASATTYRCAIEYPGILRGFGLKIRVVTRKGFEARVREL